MQVENTINIKWANYNLENIKNKWIKVNKVGKMKRIDYLLSPLDLKALNY